MRALLAAILLVPCLALAQGEDDDEEEPPEEEEEESALTATTSGEPSRATPGTAPLPEGIGKPILFRGECTPGGGPAACRVIAAAVVTTAGVESIPCAHDGEKETRGKIAARYFVPGTELELYVRGAPSGAFLVAAEDSPARGCGVRATGRRLGAPQHTYSFVALHPEDPVSLGAIRFPSGVQPAPQQIAVKALVSDGVGPANISVRTVRRFRDVHPTRSVMVLDAFAADSRAIVIAEGEGPDPATWEITWKRVADPGKPPLVLVDAFDLGADGKAEILLEKIHRGEPSEWILLHRDASGAWTTAP